MNIVIKNFLNLLTINRQAGNREYFFFPFLLTITAITIWRTDDSFYRPRFILNHILHTQCCTYTEIYQSSFVLIVKTYCKSSATWIHLLLMKHIIWYTLYTISIAVSSFTLLILFFFFMKKNINKWKKRQIANILWACFLLGCKLFNCT